jgi:type III restriction enzyme
MAIHPDFPPSPYETLNPRRRWFPAAEELRATAYEKLLPPLVANIREDVTQWRPGGYVGASATSRALFAWWVQTGRLVERSDGTEREFRNYFAQREAIETVIWPHDVGLIRDKFDLMRFDASGAVSVGMFEEEWPPYVVKMANGAGKTKVLSLLIDWCSFRELNEPALRVTRNCLLIAPDIIRPDGRWVN